jgi:hypothetical protein
MVYRLDDVTANGGDLAKGIDAWVMHQQVETYVHALFSKLTCSDRESSAGGVEDLDREDERVAALNSRAGLTVGVAVG